MKLGFLFKFWGLVYEYYQSYVKEKKSRVTEMLLKKLLEPIMHSQPCTVGSIFDLFLFSAPPSSIIQTASVKHKSPTLFYHSRKLKLEYFGLSKRSFRVHWLQPSLYNCFFPRKILYNPDLNWICKESMHFSKTCYLKV